MKIVLLALKDIQGKFVNKMIKYIYSAKSISKIVTVSEGIRESFIENLVWMKIAISYHI